MCITAGEGIIWTRNSEGRNAIHLAVLHGQLAILNLLAQWPNAPVDATDFVGNTPLHIAAFADQQTAIQTLITAGSIGLMIRM